MSVEHHARLKIAVLPKSAAVETQPAFMLYTCQVPDIVIPVDVKTLHRGKLIG